MVVLGLPSHLASSTVKDSSVVAVQIFDQRKFKRKDQGFLGVVNVRVSDVLDLELGGHGEIFYLVALRRTAWLNAILQKCCSWI